MTGRRPEQWLVTAGARSLPVSTRSGSDETVVEVRIGSGGTTRSITARILSSSEDTWVVSIEGRSTVVRVAPHQHGHHAMAAGEAFEVTSVDATRIDFPAGDGMDTAETSAAVDLDALCAPMPATVSAILVRPGEIVASGDTLVRLEAMKMELAIRAPAAGRVTAIDCRVGDLVQAGRPLARLDPHAAE